LSNLSTAFSSAARGLYGNAYVVLTATSLCWGANAVAGRLAVDQVSPMLLTQFRWLGVTLLVWTFARAHIMADWPILRANIRFFALLGASGFTLFNVLYYIAAHSTTALNIGILQGAVPVFVMMGAFLAYRTPVTLLQVIGVLITMVGVYVVTSRGEFGGFSISDINPGDGLILLACLIYAGYAVALQKRPKVSGLAMFSIMATSAFLATLPFSGYELATSQIIWPTAQGWMVVVFVVLFPSFVSQLCFMRGVELIGPGRAGVFANLVPIFASIFSVLILAETFALYHGLALVLVLGGILVAEKGRRA
jgi:drug/metabolite transporter (DMT)-like permease